VRHIEPLELRDALLVEAATVSHEPKFADRVAAHVAQLDGVLGELHPLVPTAWYPEPRAGSSRFVGRIRELWSLHSALQAQEAGLITGAVSGVAQVRGLGGVGKSILAEEYALRFAAAYPGGVFWLNGFGHGDGSLDAEQREAQRHRQVEAFAEHVGIPVVGLSPKQIQRALGRWLGERRRPCLWVVDDLAPGLGGGVRRWMAPHPVAKTLITTRSREYDAVGRSVDVSGLSAPDALDLLTNRRKPRDSAELAVARAVADELGFHPLALDVASGALRFESFAGFLAALREPSEDWLERLTAQLQDVLPNGHERSIARTLSHSLSRLDAEGLDFLRLASVLAAAPVASELVASVFGRADGLDERQAAERRLRALDQVSSLSLADPAGERGWRVHALVSRTVRFTDLAPERGQTLRVAAIAALTDALAASAAGQDEIAHARELAERASEPNELALLSCIGAYDYRRGDYHSAATLWRREYERRRELDGDDHPHTLTALSNLAATLHAQGDATGARVQHERVVEARERLLGSEHPDTVGSLLNLAATLYAQGDLAGARALYERILEVRRRMLGDEHPDTLIALSGFGAILEAQGDLVGARSTHERALEAFQRVVGDEHPDTLSELNNLAATLTAQGDLVGARARHERALEARERLLGPEHPDTLTSMTNLAGTLHADGDPADAQALYERVLEVRRRVLGEDHPDTLTAVCGLAATVLAQGDLAAARVLHERALGARERLLGDRHPDTLTAVSGLAATLLRQGELASARALCVRAFEGRRRVLGDEHPDTLDSLTHLALTLWMQGELAGALGLYERALQGRRRVLGNHHRDTLATLKTIAVLRSAMTP
jgi:tetratricopeptide (TPR) repeat protein